MAAVLCALALECAALWGLIAGRRCSPSATRPRRHDRRAGAFWSRPGSRRPPPCSQRSARSRRRSPPHGALLRPSPAAALAVAVFLRIAADLGHGIGWLRWATPIGWVEQLRPVTGADPAVLGLFAAAVAALAAATVARRPQARRRLERPAAARRRPVTDDAARRLPPRPPLRSEVPSLLAWLIGAGLLAFALGAFARSVAEEMRKVTIHTYGLTITTAAGYLAAVFAHLRPDRGALRREPRRRPARRGVVGPARDPLRAARRPPLVDRRAAGGRGSDDGAAGAGPGRAGVGGIGRHGRRGRLSPT